MTESTAKIVRTMCPMNCHPTLCGMLAEVRDGKLISLKGDDANPDSQGFLCVRGQASREIMDNPARLLHPLLRDKRGDDFRQGTWDEALDRIVASMEQSPPEGTGIWPGHGVFTTNYGTRISSQLLMRFANLYGCHAFNPAMICWGLGGFGLGLTGMLETNTKEDMGEHAELIVLWAANLASQPNTARHLLAAKRRGAHIVTIDVRHTEAAAKSDDVLIIKPGTDTALALALIHVICAEQRHDAAFVAAHTIGFDALAAHMQVYTPQWAETTTGIAADRIVTLARRYATTRPAMIVLGGSSMHKNANGWQAGRAIACLPALTGNVGIPGGGFGPRHGSGAHGRGLGSIAGTRAKAHAPAMPNQMAAVTAALRDGRIQTLLLMGSNMVSSYADATEVAAGLSRTPLVVSYDLFLNDTARRYADIVLPGTSWLEEVGAKMTHTHLYLMEQALAPAGQVWSLYRFITTLAQRLHVDDFDPWPSEEAMVDAILDHPCTGHATVAALRAEGGIRALKISHVANPTLQFDTPSGKIELWSGEAQRLGLPPLPTYTEAVTHSPDDTRTYPLTLTQGRTLAHFHSFYNNGQALPMLAKRESEPTLWIAPADAAARSVVDRDAIRIFNQRGHLSARARVTDKIPAGTLWMRDGWPGLNQLTDGSPVLPDAAVDLFPFSAGQATFDAMVDVALE